VAHLPLPPAIHATRVAVRRRLGASAWLWWSLVMALALAAGALARGAWAGADRARAAWGDAVPVVVARRDLAPGTPLAPGTVGLDTWPRALVPPGALTSLPGPEAVAVLPIAAGEAVVEARAGPLPAGPVSRLPPGTVGVAVPMDAPAAAALGLVPGTPVEVLTTDPVSGQPTLPAGGARVVAVAEGTVVVAVPEADAPAVAAAAAAGGATVVLRAGG